MNRHTVSGSRLLLVLFLFFVILAPSAASGVSGYTKKKMTREIESARSLLGQGEIDRARAALQRVLRMDPNHVGAHHLLAQMAFDRDQWAIADHHINWLLRRNPRDETALFLSALLNNRTGERLKAHTQLRILVKIGARNPAVYRELAGYLMEDGHPEEAALVLVLGTEQSASGGVLIQECGEVWKKLRHPEVALSLWQCTRAESAPNIPSLFQQAYLYHRLMDYPEARALYESVLLLSPEHDQALYNLSLIHRSEGDQEAAARTLERLIEVSPGFELAYAELARVYLTLDRPQEALDLLKRYLNIGNDPDLQVLAKEAIARLSGEDQDGDGGPAESSNDGQNKESDGSR
ncbi:MAG: tetratricopeptide repeat protein [Candidatus Eisenbacteria bacterium]|uniref:Tetratricopeptide repeat protein n=1 Tax=Eiseniibacteriota bacterium TaxID=2212470 RepID=A0A948W2Z2_UNCEI|nr:tetratricopeptide repeat protein [Candidatus Eisenbacteria bacterium]MBU1947331.1 tetratricopeptide repeat protein [Candidatus Eisenbacteria bacterium]MBU2690517.1 tetratricopeptide repeat protein [Candidatus Eisenbacteria bacterium]